MICATRWHTAKLYESHGEAINSYLKRKVVPVLQCKQDSHE